MSVAFPPPIRSPSDAEDFLLLEERKRVVGPITQESIGFNSCFWGIFLAKKLEESDGLIWGTLGLSLCGLISFGAFSSLGARHRFAGSFVRGAFCGIIGATMLDSRIIVWRERFLLEAVWSAVALMSSAFGAVCATGFRAAPSRVPQSTPGNQSRIFLGNGISRF